MGDSTLRMPRDFPPVGLYQLVDFPAPGYVLVAKGPRDTFYRRTVVPTNRQIGWGTPFSNRDRNRELVEYLAAMTHLTSERAEQIFSPADVIVPKNKPDLSAEIDARLSAQVAEIQALSIAATQRGIQGLSGLKLTIAPEVEDHRAQRAAPLPALTPRELTLP